MIGLGIPTRPASFSASIWPGSPNSAVVLASANTMTNNTDIAEQVSIRFEFDNSTYGVISSKIYRKVVGLGTTPKITITQDSQLMEGVVTYWNDTEIT